MQKVIKRLWRMRGKKYLSVIKTQLILRIGGKYLGIYVELCKFRDFALEKSSPNTGKVFKRVKWKTL